MRESYRTARIVETRNLFLGRLRHCVWAVEQEDPVRKTSGRAPAGMNGTHSTREEYAPPACINGLRRNAFPIPAGQHIRSGTLSNELSFNSLAFATKYTEPITPRLLRPPNSRCTF